MKYKHKIVNGLAKLVELYGGKGKDPMVKALWFGIKGQVPMMLQMLDENEGIIIEIEEKLREVLTEPQIEPISEDIIEVARIDQSLIETSTTRHKDGTVSLRLPLSTWENLLPSYFPRVVAPVEGNSSAVLVVEPLPEEEPSGD